MFGTGFRHFRRAPETPAPGGGAVLTVLRDVHWNQTKASQALGIHHGVGAEKQGKIAG